MLKNSGEIFYLCDKSKIGRIGFAKLSTFDQIDYFVTDGNFNDNWNKIFEDTNVKVIKAE